MDDFLSLFEASEISGWSPDRITSVALRVPDSLGIWIVPDEGGWRAELLVADRSADVLDWREGGQYQVRLTEPLRLPTDVLREQVRPDNRIRLLPGDGKPIEFPREQVAYLDWSIDLGTGTVEVVEGTEVVEIVVEAYRLRPPRRVDHASLFVRRDEWSAVVATEGRPEAREGRIARLKGAADAGTCRLTPPAAAKALGVHPKTLRRRLIAASKRTDLPRVWSVREGKKGGKRYLLLDDLEALRLWLQLMESTSAEGSLQQESMPSVPPRARARSTRPDAVPNESIRERARRARRRS